MIGIRSPKQVRGNSLQEVYHAGEVCRQTSLLDDAAAAGGDEIHKIAEMLGIALDLVEGRAHGSEGSGVLRFEDSRSR